MYRGCAARPSCTNSPHGVSRDRCSLQTHAGSIPPAFIVNAHTQTHWERRAGKIPAAKAGAAASPAWRFCRLRKRRRVEAARIMAANRPLAEIPRSTDLSQLCGRRRGAVVGALGAQLRPKRGRSASRGLPRAARRPGAPPRPRRRRPAALRRQRRSTEVNGAAEPRRLPLQVLRPPAAGRGDGLCAAPQWIEVLRGTGQPGEHVGCTAASPVLRWLLIFMMGERHFSTG